MNLSLANLYEVAFRRGYGRRILHFSSSLLSVFVTTVLAFAAFRLHFNLSAIGSLYLLLVVFVSLRWGIRPGYRHFANRSLLHELSVYSTNIRVSSGRSGKLDLFGNFRDDRAAGQRTLIEAAYARRADRDSARTHRGAPQGCEAWITRRVPCYWWRTIYRSGEVCVRRYRRSIWGWGGVQW
jgi:hypothetical protein